MLAERSREEAERLRRAVLEAALDGYISVDEDGRILEFNPAAERIFGYRRDEILGQSMEDLLVPRHSRDRHHEGFRRHVETGVASILGRTIEVTAMHAREHEVPIEIVILRSALEGRPVFIAYLRDLTAQKRAEALAAETAARFQAISDGVPLPIVISALDAPEVLFANARARQMLGLEAGRTGREVLSVWSDPGCRRRLMAVLDAQGAVEAFETSLRTPDGGRLDVLISARRIQHDGRPALFAAVTDITAQRRAEAEIARQRESLHQSEKLTALGSLLAGVAHELNNPLSVVVGYAALLQEFSSEPDTRRRAEKIHDAAARCSRIVWTFLAMARK